MPDRYGRVGYNDFMGVASALEGIDQNNKRNILFRQNQEDRAKKQKRTDQYNTALTGMQNTGELPEGTPVDIGVAAKENYGKGLQADANIAQYKEDKEVARLTEGILKWRSENPDSSWDNVPSELFVGKAGHRALASLIDREAQTEQGKTTIMKNRLGRSQVAFQQFQNSKGFINDALSKGDTQNAVNGIEKMSRELPIPYQIKGFDPATQDFQVEYLDSKTGKFQRTDTVSLQEMVQKINAIGEKQFVTLLASGYETTRQGNVEKRKNPMMGKGLNGRRYLIIPQKNVLQPSQVDIEVRDEKTNEKIMFSSWEALNDAGIHVENLPREKALTALAGEGAKTKEAAQKAKGARLDTDIKQTKKFKNDLYFMLEPFKKPGMDLQAMFDGDGLSQPGKGALEAAIAFYEKHKEDTSLDGTDKMKFDKAVDAIKLYNGMSATINKSYSQDVPKSGPKVVNPSDKPPARGARQAKDGNWYIPDPNRPGKFVRVDVEGNK